MSAKLLDGKLLAKQLSETLAKTIKLAQSQVQPTLAVILVGTDPASQVYVRNKRASCEKVGIRSLAYDLPESVSEAQLLALIQELNDNKRVHGILVQLPLPNTINTQSIIEAISPHKDVDGFHPYNLGRLAQGRPLLRPCTPFGIIQLLENAEIPVAGKNAVVVGASNIVGRPMALELLLARATPTVCHRQTASLENFVRQADILIVAAGQQDLIHPSWMKPSAVAIDVGIHRLPNGKLAGDLDTEAFMEKVSYLTPVPGGVGPMTVFTLLKNTWECAKKSVAIEEI